MKRKVIIFLVCVSMTLLLHIGFALARGSSGVTGGAFVTGDVGTRPMGMGGAFVAMPGDANSIMWNPAGLGTLTKLELTTMYANLYSLDYISQSFIGYVIPVKGFGAQGISWSHIGVDFESSGSSWAENTFIYSYARKLMKNSFFGFNLKYYKVSSDFSGGKANGYGLDAGYLLYVNHQLTFGVYIRDLFSRLSWDTGHKERLNLAYKLGIGYKPCEKIAVALDLDGMQTNLLAGFHIGGEYWFLFSKGLKKVGVNRRRRSMGFRGRYFPQTGGVQAAPTFEKVGVRAGIEKELLSDKRTKISLGLSAVFNYWQFDYAYLIDDDALGDTHRFSFGIRF